MKPTNSLVSIAGMILVITFQMHPAQCENGAASDIYWKTLTQVKGYGPSPEVAISRACRAWSANLTGEVCNLEITSDNGITARGSCVRVTGECVRMRIEAFQVYCDGGYYNASEKKCVVPDTPQPDRGSPMCPSPLQGNPIHALTGNKYQKEMDFQAHTPFPLSIVRSYNSYDNDGQHTIFGNGWRDRYSNRIFTSNSNNFYIYHADGSLHNWSLSGGSLVSDTDPGSGLVKNADGWVHTDRAGNVRRYDVNGYLVEVVNPAGLSHQISYDSLGMVSSVTDSFGNKLTYEYDTRLLVSAIQTPDGETYRYDYDDKGNLIAVIYPDDTPELSDNPRKTYHYEDARYPHYLTGITNENNNRYATWAYDDAGRAISSVHAEDSDRYTFQYNEAGATEITDPLNNVRTFNFTSPKGLIRVESVDGGPCPDCGQKAAAYQYDDSGLVKQKSDQKNNLVTYTRDAYGREQTRTEAAGTEQARTVSTEWHSDFNKPTRITEPGRITEFSYDDNGRLLSKTERTAP